MQYVRIAKYTINKAPSRRSPTRRRRACFPSSRQQTGFVRYGLADMGEQNCLSISLWNTREDAVASEMVASTWARENLGDNVQLKSSHVGNLAFFEGVLATV